MTNSNSAVVSVKFIRVFFAIFPNKTTQSLLADQAINLQSLCAGRKITKRHIHLTLLFLGNLLPNRIAELHRIANHISARSFELNLEEIRYWKHNRIVYIQARQFPSELFTLVDSLTDHVSAAGFIVDKRIYRPHVTLIRDAIRPVIVHLDNSIRWPVDEWSLVQSLQTEKGVRYDTLGQWALRKL